MNVMSAKRDGKQEIRSVHRLTKQIAVVLEQDGVAIRVRYDKQRRQFRIEDLTPNEAKLLNPIMRENMDKILGEKP